MPEYKPKFTEQELASEEFIKTFLAEHGIATNKASNMQRLFLYGIYNGLVIASTLVQQGRIFEFSRIASIFKVYFAARERVLKEFKETDS